MKILFYIDCLGSGGKERRLTELMKQLRRMNGVNFELVLMTRGIHFEEVLTMGIKIHYLIRTTRKDPTIFRSFYKLCRKINPDIVHCWDSMTAVYSIPACKLLNIKLVNGMVVDTPVRQNLKNKDWFRARITFPFSNRIIGNSKAGLKAYRAPSRKSTCIYNGMDLNRFEGLDPPGIVRRSQFGIEDQNAFVIGMVARFHARKDYRTLVSTAVKLLSGDKSMYFILIGTGEDHDEILDSVPDINRDRILFLGNRSDVENLVNAFDVGVLLTNSKVHGEGISNSIIEYMALGKPVIASRGGGTDEVVLDGINGCLIDSESPDQLEKCIDLFYNDRTLIEKFGTAGRNLIHTEFEIQIMTHRYLELYNRMLKRDR